VKGLGAAFSFRELLGRKISAIFRQIFDDCELNAFSNLWSSQPNSWCIAQGVMHIPDQSVDVAATNFIQRKFTGRAAENGWSQLK
jgi:hypothetical protein